MHLPPKPTAALLNQQPFFHGIAWTSLERLAALASYAHFPEQQLIFESGGHAEQFYVLLRGSVALEAPSGTGDVSVVQSLEAGETLGWSWLFPPYRWSFSARALVSVDALVLPGGILRTRCEEDPIMAAAMMRRVAGVMLDRLQATRRRLATLEKAAAGVPIHLTVSAAPASAVSPDG
ncbi:MAG: cyclic nucleotide-binding domain-containing protein [Verrucomicrobiales bacterium]|nr:cyclic nucleotide-binding domain-containing protein [Verrucomicrobiales bacterium]